MRSLEAHGVPAAVLDGWERSCGTELLPVQERAVRMGVLAGASLLVCAPTSSGKTFIGEMAAIHAALTGHKVVYLVPTKALAEAKYRRFAAHYAPLGLRVAIATRDRRAGEREIARGEFDLLVAVPEKARSLLADRPALAGDLGAVITDELQMLGDPERGPCLELLLGDLRAASADLQIVGLSAVLGRADELAEWLDAAPVLEARRPVELRKGVLEGGMYYYRQHNDGAEGSEFWAELSGGAADFGERLAQVAAHLAQADGPVLVFVRDKRATARLAQEIAHRADLGPAQETRAELRRLERTRATEVLARLAERGVGYHSADLQFSEREVVEAGFARGELGALVCTSTLAVGVNLPARTVLVDHQRWRGGGAGGRPTLGPISRGDFENMAGRAGRLGRGDEFGRAVLLAEGEVQREVLLASYARGDFDRLEPPLRALAPLRQVCLLAGSTARSAPDALAQAWQRTFAARAAGLPPGMLPSALREAADLAAAEGLVEESDDGGLRPTALGRLAGAGGLTPRSFLALLRAARAAEGRAPDEVQALLVAALTDEAQAVPLPPPGWAAAPADEFAAPAEDAWELEALLEAAAQTASSSPSAEARERAVRIVLALGYWRGPLTTAEVERRTRMSAGRLSALAEAVGWAVEVLARLGRELGWAQTDWAELMRLGRSVAAGVPEEGLALHELHVPGMGRGQIRALLAAGIKDRAALARAGAATLERVLGPAPAARALAVVCGLPVDRREAPEPPPLPDRPPALRGPAERGELLIIDRRRPDRVLLAGVAVDLRPAEFRLLEVLAARPQCCVDYEAIYEGMWGDETFVEPAQIYSHRSRLARKLGAATERGEQLVRTIPKRGLMLDLPPEKVSVR